MGASGAGKTRLEAIAGLRPGARGRVAVQGRVLLDTAAGASRSHQRRHVGYVPQDRAVPAPPVSSRTLRFGARADAAAVETASIR